jgi:hypothetical protein
VTASSRLALAASVALSSLTFPALAQETPATGDAPPPTPVEAPAPDKPEPVAGRQVYTPADFLRFAPKNAFDMVRNIPGFQIRENEQQRGFGQGTGNILINGERPSNKSDFLSNQLQRIPADSVTRIEVVDGATLDVPGLSGQVANVLIKADAFSGQFAWKPQTRAHFTDPLLTRGQISATGLIGAVQYEVGLDNDDSGRSGAGGLTRILDAAGTVTERRNDIWTSRYDSPKASVKLTIPTGSTVAHVNGQYQRTFSFYDETGIRVSPTIADRTRFVRERNDTWNYEFGGDWEFGLGPGKLKLIGLNRKSHEPYRQDVITDTADAFTLTVGDRFAQVGDITEKIARGEYNWKMLGGDWQLSGEGAFNKLDNVARLGTLNAAGEFIETPFAEGTGEVQEDRYEGLLSFSRPLSKTISFQIVGGAEHSTISQTGVTGLTRRFFRPKGSLSLAWKPSETFDLSAKLRRRVLQLSFYDFLARSFVDDNNQNAGNNQLVPQQDWSLEIEANKNFGAWGSTKLRLINRDVEDFVDIVPVGTGESIGNIAKANARAIDWTSTIQFDPIGWKGAKLDTRVLLQHSSLLDPFTGEKRQYSNFTDTLIELNFRRDIPGSDWAYGTGANYSHNQPRYRRSSVDHTHEGPVFAEVFVENKDVFGLTMRVGVDNIVNARSRRERDVFTGLRGASPISFRERRNRLIGPIFFFAVTGTL